MYHGITAIKMNISSQANMLPNKRKARDNGLETSSSTLNITLMGARYQPNGFDNTSFVRPPIPLAFML